MDEQPQFITEKAKWMNYLERTQKERAKYQEYLIKRRKRQERIAWAILVAIMALCFVAGRATAAPMDPPPCYGVIDHISKRLAQYGFTSRKTAAVKGMEGTTDYLFFGHPEYVLTLRKVPADSLIGLDIDEWKYQALCKDDVFKPYVIYRRTLLSSKVIKKN